jgi:hypothetical protein
MLELPVAVGMKFPLAGLAIRLQAVTQLPQQTVHSHVAHHVPLGRQFLGQFPRALAGPEQRAVRIAPCRRFQQTLQVRQQRCILGHATVPPTPRPPHPPPAHPIHQLRQLFLNLLDAPYDGIARHPRRPGHRAHPTPTHRQSLAPRPTPSKRFVHGKRECIILVLNRDPHATHLRVRTAKGTSKVRTKCSSYFVTDP